MTPPPNNLIDATDSILQLYPQSSGIFEDDVVYDDYISSTEMLGVVEFESTFTSASPPIYGVSPRPVAHALVKYYVNSILIPGFLCFGALGNAICLALIINRAGRCPRICSCISAESRHRPWSSGGTSVPMTGRSWAGGGGPVKLQPLERSALVGLGALAVSDLLFCLVGLPSVWLRPSGATINEEAPLTAKLAFYYTRVYKVPLHNMFLLSSTWIAVAIAVERFIAVGSPIRARWLLKARYSVFAAVLIFFAAALVSGPLFFRNQFRTYNCSKPLPGCRLLLPEPSNLFQNVQFRTAYQAIWSTLGTFLPLVLLTVSSCGLVGVLYRTRIAGITNPERYPCMRVTATVTAVVTTFIVLVCPSTVCEAVLVLSSSHQLGEAYLLAITICNMGQALWFGANFLLYCGCANIRRRFFPKRSTLSSTQGGATVTCQLAVRGGHHYCHSDSGTPGSRSPQRGHTTGGSRQDIASSDGLSDGELQCDLVASTGATGVRFFSHGRGRAGLSGCSSGIGTGGGGKGGGSLTRIRVQFFDDDVKKLVDVEQL